MEKKYTSKRPLYLVLGDFNLYIEKSDLSGGWDLQPIDRNTARNLRPRRPLDYVLTSGLDQVEKFAREFSPLPLKLEENDGVVSYCFSNAANLLSDDRKPISREDLEHVSLNKLDMTLLGNIIFNTCLHGPDEFVDKPELFIGHQQDTKRTFDHDFIFFHARIQDTVQSLIRLPYADPFLRFRKMIL